MREILFKAKRISDGQWVYGNLFVDDKSEKAEILCGYTNYRLAWEVDTETISQYIGLCDKNGRKIWENDIVTKNNRFGKVVYGEKNCECCNGVYGWTFEHIGRYSTVVDIREQNTVEVVGNIFDNEEFLNISDEVE